MKDRWMAWKKICICLLLMVIVFSAGTGVGRTEAWFFDAGMWVEGSYGIGVIDYTVYINGKNVEKIKGGQKVSLTIPMVGGAKLDDAVRPVAAVTSTLSGAAVSIGAHDEFDEGVTLVRTRIVNTGGLPIGIRAKVERVAGLSDRGIQYRVLPGQTILEENNYGLTTSGGAFQTYRTFIQSSLENDNQAIISHPGKLPSFDKPDEATEAFEVNILCWADYESMPWSTTSGALDNKKPVEERKGQLILHIECTL